MRIGSLISTGILFLCALSSAAVFSTEIAHAVAYVGIDSNIRPNDFLPTDHSPEAMSDLAKSVGGDVGLANVRFLIKLPLPDRRTGQFTDQDLKGVSVSLIGAADRGLKIDIHPELSDLKIAIVNGEDVIFGHLTGTVTYPDGKNAEMTVGVIALTRPHRGHFTVAISAHNGIPPLTMAFGNLEPSPELLQLVIPRQ